MSKTVKVAISLPEDLYAAAERERDERGESRSEFYRRAIRVLLEREAELQYIRGYTEHPETEEEVADAEALTAESWATDPWEAE